MFQFETVLAVVISVASLIFSLIGRTPDLFYGFRTSESTMKKMDHINERLSTELNSNILQFQSYCVENVKNKNELNSEIKNEYEDIGRKVYVVNNISQDLLKNTTKHAKNVLKYFLSSFVLALVIIFYYFYMSGYIWDFIFYILYGGAFIVVSYICYSNYKKYNKTYELFLELDEEPTIEKALGIWLELP